MKIEINNPAKFSDEFLDKFLESGFGALSKREIEILVYNLLVCYSDLRTLSNYQKSLKLKISLSKIKNLDLERNLKYTTIDPDTFVKEVFYRLMRNANIKLHKASHWILFSIEDDFEREAIIAKLKELKHFSDTSFNKELLTMDKEAFLALVEFCYGKAEVKINNEKVEKLLKADGEITARSIYKKFLEGAATKAGEKTVELGLTFLTGGVSDFSGIIKKIGELF